MVWGRPVQGFAALAIQKPRVLLRLMCFRCQKHRGVEMQIAKSRVFLYFGALWALPHDSFKNVTLRIRFVIEMSFLGQPTKSGNPASGASPRRGHDEATTGPRGGHDGPTRRPRRKHCNLHSFLNVLWRLAASRKLETY